ncbi:type III polyketide synthase [bacterium]|nr:type III polyketide synthase [bacterium]
MPPLSIAGIGTAVPPNRISQSDAAATAAALVHADHTDQRKLAVLYRSTGVRHRASVLLDSSTNGEASQQSFYQPQQSYGDRGPTTARRMERYKACAGELAAEACRKAIAAADVAPSSITHLITISCSGFHAPGADLWLISQLGLSPMVSRTHVGFMGCHGALNGLRAAQAYASADPNAVILLCAVELCSLHQYYGWHHDRLVANALFADGAAAIVGVPAGTQQTSRPQLIANGSFIIPDTTDLMSWRIGDHGFEMTLSAEVPHAIRRHLKDWLSNWLSQYNLTIDQVRSWAIHPGGPRVLTAAGEAAGITDQQLQASRTILAECGNMSSPTVLFILDLLWRAQAPGPYVALAFGPGLAIEAALFTESA